MSNDIIKQLKTFYNKDRVTITKLLRRWCEEVMFSDFPQLEKKCSVLLSGSVAINHYDKYSDIDIAVIFHQDRDWKKYKWKILSKYKWGDSEIVDSPVSFHGMNIRSLAQVKTEMESYKVDWRMHEYISAELIYDTNKTFEKLRRRFRWYPVKVYKSKLNWLFAESNFQLYDRYFSSLKRRNEFHCAAVKTKIIRLLANAILLGAKQFPSQDKHLLNRLKSLDKRSAVIIRIIMRLLRISDIKKSAVLLEKLLKLVERELLRKKLILKKDNQYWIDLRPEYRIEFES